MSIIHSKILRLRLGIILFVLSWMPIAQVILVIAHDNGKLTSDKASQNLRLVVWTIQFLVGLIGVWLAGKVAISTAKESGWRHAPKKLWRLFWQGEQN